MPELLAVYLGRLRELPPEGQLTGMFKTACQDRLWIGPEGLEGDVQADRRFHGGPEKAVHQMSLTTYQRISEKFPLLKAMAQPGSLGENLSVTDMDDSNVCIGDRIRIGTALLEVSQPRSPCWKINHRFDEASLSRFLQDSGCPGWYYRVLEPGHVQAGDAVAIEARPHPDHTLSALWVLYNDLNPSLATLADWAALDALNSDWRLKFRQRLEWLEKHRA